MSSLIASDGRILTFDSVLSEDFEEPATVTEHPVEGRVGISDNIQVRPRLISVVAIVTETPLQQNTQPDDVLLPVQEDPSQRPITARNFIDETRGDVYTYISSQGLVIENVALLNMSYARRNQLNYVFDLSFRRIGFATSQLVDLPPARIRPSKSKPVGPKGGQTPKDPPGSTPPPFTSAASDVGVGSLFDL